MQKSSRGTVLRDEEMFSYLYDEDQLKQTSLICNPSFRLFSCDSPLIQNPWWNGICKFRYKTELETSIKIYQNNAIYRVYHFQVAYIHPEASCLVDGFIRYTIEAAREEHERNFKKTKTKVKIWEADLGRGKQVVKVASDRRHTYASIFFHQPEKTPPILSYNWPLRPCYPSL